MTNFTVGQDIGLSSSFNVGDTVKTISSSLDDGTPLYGNGTFEIPMNSKLSDFFQTWVEGEEAAAPPLVNKIDIQVDAGDHTVFMAAFEAVTLSNGQDSEGKELPHTPQNAIYLWQGTGQDWRFHNYSQSADTQLIYSGSSQDPNCCDISLNGHRSLALVHNNTSTCYLYALDSSGSQLASVSMSFTDSSDFYQLAISENGNAGVFYKIDSSNSVACYRYDGATTISYHGTLSIPEMRSFNQLGFNDNKSIYISDDGQVILVVTGAGQVLRNDLSGGHFPSTVITEITNAKLIDPQTGFILVDAGDSWEMRDHLNVLQQTIAKPSFKTPKYQLDSDNYFNTHTSITDEPSIHRVFFKRGRYIIGQARFGSIKYWSQGSSSSSSHYVYLMFTYDTVTGDVFMTPAAWSVNSYTYGGFLLPYKNGGTKSLAEGEPMMWCPSNCYVYLNATSRGPVEPLELSNYKKFFKYAEEMTLGKVVGEKP